MPSSAGEIEKELKLALGRLVEEKGHSQKPNETVFSLLHEPNV